MNYSLFPNHYHITAPQYGTSYYNLGQRSNYLLSPSMNYSYLPTPYIVPQPTLQAYSRNHNDERIDIILIAIIILVSLDLIFIRPLKKI